MESERVQEAIDQLRGMAEAVREARRTIAEFQVFRSKLHDAIAVGPPAGEPTAEDAGPAEDRQEAGVSASSAPSAVNEPDEQDGQPETVPMLAVRGAEAEADPTTLPGLPGRIRALLEGRSAPRPAVMIAMDLGEHPRRVHAELDQMLEAGLVRWDADGWALRATGSCGSATR